MKVEEGSVKEKKMLMLDLSKFDAKNKFPIELVVVT